MLLWILVSVLCIAVAQESYTGEYGGTGGIRFSQNGNQLDGPITALRVRVGYNIIGIQIRYGETWSEYEGGIILGDLQEIFLDPGEHIVQVSGYHTLYLKKLDFLTNNNRNFSFGRNQGIGFTAIPLYPNTILKYISGRSSLVINAIGFHWNTPSRNCIYCNK